MSFPIDHPHHQLVSLPILSFVVSCWIAPGVRFILGQKIINQTLLLELSLVVEDGVTDEISDPVPSFVGGTCGNALGHCSKVKTVIIRLLNPYPIKALEKVTGQWGEQIF